MPLRCLVAASHADIARAVQAAAVGRAAGTRAPEPAPVPLAAPSTGQGTAAALPLPPGAADEFLKGKSSSVQGVFPTHVNSQL